MMPFKRNSGDAFCTSTTVGMDSLMACVPTLDDAGAGGVTASGADTDTGALGCELYCAALVSAAGAEAGAGADCAAVGAGSIAECGKGGASFEAIAYSIG